MSCDHCGAQHQPGRFCYGCGKKMPPRAVPAVRVRRRSVAGRGPAGDR